LRPTSANSTSARSPNLRMSASTGSGPLWRHLCRTRPVSSRPAYSGDPVALVGGWGPWRPWGNIERTNERSRVAWRRRRTRGSSLQSKVTYEKVLTIQFAALALVSPRLRRPVAATVPSALAPASIADAMEDRDCQAASNTFRTVAVRRRKWNLRKLAETCSLVRERDRRKLRNSS
jgi:hypothetical protein